MKSDFRGAESDFSRMKTSFRRGESDFRSIVK